MTKNELKEKINKAKFAYYNTDTPIMTDKEYDNLIKEYGDEPSVGAPLLDSIKKIIIIDKPMLSLDKVHNEKDIISFSKGNDLIASIKCDGLSVRLIYQNGFLLSANTRGNGFEGADITEHIKYFLNVPLKILKTERYIIDGEAIIYDNDFNIINQNQQFKNNRNTASGSLALLDMNIVKQRRLSFIAWDVIQGGCSLEYYHYNIEEAENLGFTVVPSLILDCTKITQEKIIDINNDLLKISKEEGIPCDGIVWRINNIQEGKKRGQTAHHFLDAIAWKPNDETYNTTLKNIEWTMGRTGVLTPIAIFEPLNIDGSTVERASLHNVSIMTELLGECPYIDEPIEIYKANQIIPQIAAAAPKYDYLTVIKNKLSPINKITNCPYCNGEIGYVTSPDGVVNAFCNNPSCEGKLINRLDHFCGKKGLDIKGLSKATFEKLIDWEWITCLYDVFKLHEYRTEWINKSGFGVASVDKILKAIEEKRNNITLDAFIAAIGIPLIGRVNAQELAKTFKTYKDFKESINNDSYSFAILNGFGYEMNDSLKRFDYTEADKIACILHFKDIENNNLNNSLNGQTIVITGKLIMHKNRDELKYLIEKRGGKVASSISSKTNILINNDIESTSSKNIFAKDNNIPIMSEKDFVEKYF